MPAQLQRDPFARATLMRVKATPGECATCDHVGRRWTYYWERDGLNKRGMPRLDRSFCSVGCYRAYYD